MAAHKPIIRLKTYMLIVAILTMAFPSITIAATEGARLILRPHCEPKNNTESDGTLGGGLEGLSNDFFLGSNGTPTTSACPLFSIRDPLTRETPILNQGDTLDMDLVLVQDESLQIMRVRSWLAYDPDILDGDLIETSGAFPDIAPGEKDFVPAEGYIKIDISTADPSSTGNTEIVIARIRMRVKETPVKSTPISFYDVTQTPEGHTMVISGEGTDARNILFPELGSLLVRLNGATESITNPLPPPPQPVPPAQPAHPATPEKTPPPTQPETITILQVQNIGVTTEGTNIFLGWDPLSTPDIIGYNVYYAARSGEYIHKRSLDATATSTIVRDLPTGIKFFFAIRGVNRAQQESAFSKEVAVTVGSPATSTAPLAASMLPKAAPALRTLPNVATVPGQTGISSWITGTIVGIALIATVLAIRKQFLLS